jgi:hypothetical protein
VGEPLISSAALQVGELDSQAALQVGSHRLGFRLVGLSCDEV